MFHKFVDFYMATNNYILYACAYIKILFENYPKLFSFFHSYSSLSHVVHSHQYLLLLGKVCAVYARALGLSPPIFNQNYLTGMFTCLHLLAMGSNINFQLFCSCCMRHSSSWCKYTYCIN